MAAKVRVTGWGYDRVSIGVRCRVKFRMKLWCRLELGCRFRLIVRVRVCKWLLLHVIEGDGEG